MSNIQAPWYLPNRSIVVTKVWLKRVFLEQGGSGIRIDWKIEGGKEGLMFMPLNKWFRVGCGFPIENLSLGVKLWMHFPFFILFCTEGELLREAGCCPRFCVEPENTSPVTW